MLSRSKKPKPVTGPRALFLGGTPNVDFRSPF